MSLEVGIHELEHDVEVVVFCLFLLSAVVAGSIVSRLLPCALPRPLVQFGLGTLRVYHFLDSRSF